MRMFFFHWPSPPHYRELSENTIATRREFPPRVCTLGFSAVRNIFVKVRGKTEKKYRTFRVHLLAAQVYTHYNCTVYSTHAHSYGLWINQSLLPNYFDPRSK